MFCTFVAAHPDKIGIGIDEDTCALFEAQGLLRVVGKGCVTIVDTHEMSYTNLVNAGATDPLSVFNLRVHILSYGDQYNFHSRRPSSAPSV